MIIDIGRRDDGQKGANCDTAFHFVLRTSKYSWDVDCSFFNFYIPHISICYHRKIFVKSILSSPFYVNCIVLNSTKPIIRMNNALEHPPNDAQTRGGRLLFFSPHPSLC